MKIRKVLAGSWVEAGIVVESSVGEQNLFEVDIEWVVEVGTVPEQVETGIERG